MGQEALVEWKGFISRYSETYLLIYKSSSSSIHRYEKSFRNFKQSHSYQSSSHLLWQVEIGADTQAMMRIVETLQLCDVKGQR